MRYRPFGRSGVVVSAVTLVIGDDIIRRGQQRCSEMISAALDHGINAFHIETAQPDAAIALGQAVRVLERNLAFVSMRLGLGRGRTGMVRDFSAEALSAAIEQTLRISGLGYLDLVVLDDPGEEELPQRSLAALKSLRSAGRINLLGVAGVDDAMDAYLSTGAFDVLATPYGITSGWKERNRMRAAVEQDMAILAYDWLPDNLDTPKKADRTAPTVRRGLFGKVFQEPDPFEGIGGYAFLHRTSNWTAEEICLGFTLTEPSVSSAWITPGDLNHLDALAEVPDRDLPPGLGAQIEMARFTAREQKAG
ncbi:MAG: aldo/keto reductase [Caulobacteraceae bacterium]|nr:aldo/keto reductase [Caulobacteraceae bacterium]